MDGPGRKRIKTDFSNLQTDKGHQHESRTARFKYRLVSILKEVVGFTLRYVTGSRRTNKKYTERRIASVPAYLPKQYNTRLDGKPWKSTVSLGGLNELKIRNLIIALSWLENRAAESDKNTELVALLRKEKEILDAENRGVFKNIDPQAAISDKAFIRSVKNHNNVLTGRIAKAIKRDYVTKKTWLLKIKNLKQYLTKIKISTLNEQEWLPVNAKFKNPEIGELVSKQIPAAHIRAPGKLEAGSSKEADLFPLSYKKGGICSASTDCDNHAVNLLTSSFEKDGVTLYQGVRHATHSAYGIKDPEQRRNAAEVRTKESVLAALSLKPLLLREALENPDQSIPLNIVSTSLLTPTPIWLAKLSGNKLERQMLEDQLAGFQALANPESQPVKLEVVDRDGTKKTIQVRLQALCFNFGVNRVALDRKISKLTGGWKVADKINAESLETLTGDLNNATDVHGGWVQQTIEHKIAGQKHLKSQVNALQPLLDSTRLELNSAEKAKLAKEMNKLRMDIDKIQHDISIIRQLTTQIRGIFKKKLHRGEYDDPYKMPARILLLTNLLEGVPLSNCKSGKDRTGMLDAEVKLLAARIFRDKKVPEPATSLEERDHQLFQQILLNSGNFEVQEYNTGRPGYMINGVKSVDKRIGSAAVAIDVRGSSGAVRS